MRAMTLLLSLALGLALWQQPADAPAWGLSTASTVSGTGSWRPLLIHK
jgi:hypothetical protein